MSSMTTEEHIERVEKNVHRLAVVQDEMMDLLGLTVEAERRLATRMEGIEKPHQENEQAFVETNKAIAGIGEKLAATDDKLNTPIGVVDGFVRGKG